MTFMYNRGPLRAKVLAILRATRTHSQNLALFAFSYKTMLFLLRNFPGPGTLRPSLSATVSRLAERRRDDTAAAALGDTLARTAVVRSRKEASTDSFLAGLVAGYLVFGRRAVAGSSVTQQIVIYVFARSMLGLAKLAVAPPSPRPLGAQAGYSPRAPGGAGLLERLLPQGERGERWRRRVQRDSWAVFASVSWATVMWLWRWHPDVLQPSLRSSMNYLYANCEVWDGWRNFLWHNT